MHEKHNFNTKTVFTIVIGFKGVVSLVYVW